MSTPQPSSTTQSIPPQPDTDHVVEISAFTVNKRIIGKDLGKAINVALRNEVQESLSDLPSWVIGHVHEFTHDMYPLVKAPKTAPSGNGAKSSYIMNTLQETPAEASERFQNFYALLEQDLRLGGSPFSSGHKDSRGDEDKGDQEQRIEEALASESRVRQVLETVEHVVCSLFYDRQVLFVSVASLDNHRSVLKEYTSNPHRMMRPMTKPCPVGSQLLICSTLGWSTWTFMSEKQVPN